MRSGRGAVRAFDPAGLDLGSGDGAEETEVGAGVSDMAERADECRSTSKEKTMTIYDPTALRRELHEMPELALHEKRTSAYVAEKL